MGKAISVPLDISEGLIESRIEGWGRTNLSLWLILIFFFIEMISIVYVAAFALHALVLLQLLCKDHAFDFVFVTRFNDWTCKTWK